MSLFFRLLVKYFLQILSSRIRNNTSQLSELTIVRFHSSRFPFSHLLSFPYPSSDSSSTPYLYGTYLFFLHPAIPDLELIFAGRKAVPFSPPESTLRPPQITVEPLQRSLFPPPPSPLLPPLFNPPLVSAANSSGEEEGS